MPNTTAMTVGRRAFLRGGTLTLLAAGLDLGAARLVAADSKPKLRVGLLTDLHYADKPPNGTRHYRETPAKLAEAVGRFSQEKPDFTVELGDLVDAADVETERKWLGTIHEQISRIPGPKHYVLGNHCVDTLTKEEFLGGVGQEKSFYSFDVGGYHFTVLDACFRGDGVPYARTRSGTTPTSRPLNSTG